MIEKLRKRFIRIAALSVTAVLLLLCAAVAAGSWFTTDAGLTKMLEVIRDNQGELPPMPPGGKPGDRPDGQFTPETPYSTRYFVLRYTDGGELVQADLGKIAAVTEDDVGAYLEIAAAHGEGFGYADGYKFCVVRHDEGRWMAVFLDCHQQLRSVGVTAALSFGATAVCTALVCLLIVLFSRRAVAPVAASYERQKRFVTDASHELKTPVTVIATSLRVLELEVGKQKWIDKAMAQTEKLTGLVNSLVTMSRLDEERPPLHPAEFDAGAAAQETAESFREYAQERGHALETQIEPDVRFVGDEYAVRQLCSILLDNAVKYAAPGSDIRFSLGRWKRGIVIRTSNGCEGGVPDNPDRLFDRFYRADEARGGAGGFGLGLSMARGVAEAHRGTIRARDAGGGRIEFTAELNPLAQAEKQGK